MDTQRKTLKQKVTEEEDKEEVGEHLPTCTEMYRCATYAAEPRLRHSSTTHDPPHTNTSLSTQTHHDHNHSRRRREAAKSDRNQANTERAPQAAAKKSTADVKDNAKENRRKKTKEKGEELGESIMELATSAAADENEGTKTDSRHDKSEQRREKDEEINPLIEESRTIGKKTKGA